MILLQMHSDHPISSHLSRLLVDIQNASSAGARSARAGQITSWAGGKQTFSTCETSYENGPNSLCHRVGVVLDFVANELILGV